MMVRLTLLLNNFLDFVPLDQIASYPSRNVNSFVVQSELVRRVAFPSEFLNAFTP
jgi:hypothetical protein